MSASHKQADELLTRLEWTVIRKLDGLLQGDYRTLFRGFGLDFADLREYQATDDVRHIDWNVTARTQIPHVRVYNEDREVTAWFLLDLSPSVDFGSGTATKRQVLTEFVAVIARLLTKQGNRVGALLYNGVSEFIVPPGGGRRHVLHLLDKILAHPRLLRAPQTDVAAFIRRMLTANRRRSVVFVVSDFISRPGWAESLLALTQRHESVAVRLLDPLESALPDIGMMSFEDAESGEQLFVDTTDPAFRKRFVTAAEKAEDDMMDAFALSGTDVLELTTDGDLLDAVVRFAGMRKAQARSNFNAAEVPA
jgi:uncharacterized protein (DUF58 family)